MTKKGYTKLCATVLSLLYLLIFISFYIITYLPSVNLLEVSDGVYYSVDCVTSLIDYCLPLLSAVTVLALAGGCIKKAILYSLVFASPRFFYLFPYYYLYEIAYGNDSVESIELSVLITLGLIIVLTIHIMILYLIIYLVTNRLTQKRLRSELPACKQKDMSEKYRSAISLQARESLDKELCAEGIIDISVPIVAGIFAASFLDFLYLLIRECISAGSYLVNFAGSYTTDEIILMVSSFLFILLKLVISHLFGIVIKNLAIRYSAKEKTV